MVGVVIVVMDQIAMETASVVAVDEGMVEVVGGQEVRDTTVIVLDHMNGPVVAVVVIVLEKMMLTVQVWITCFYHYHIFMIVLQIL